MDFYDVPYHIIPNDEECVINASQIGKRIGEAPSTIRTWANQYEEYLYIKKVNGRFVYTEKSVIQFEFIKKLRDKGFPHVTIEEIIRNNGFDCDIDSQTIKSGNPIELQALATGLSLENKKQFEQFMVLMMEQQEKTKQLQKNSIWKKSRPTSIRCNDFRLCNTYCFNGNVCSCLRGN